jgi:hypothetical protein
MQKVISLFIKPKISTQRVDDLASNAARVALDERVNRMLSAHALLPVQARTVNPPLSNPIQIAAVS